MLQMVVVMEWFYTLDFSQSITYYSFSYSCDILNKSGFDIID